MVEFYNCKCLFFSFCVGIAGPHLTSAHCAIKADNNCDFFLEDLKDDVSSSMAELQHLERMTTDTLSFEELLAHCTALYNWNEDGVSKLEAQLQQYGYTPGISHVQLAIMFGLLTAQRAAAG